MRRALPLAAVATMMLAVFASLAPTSKVAAADTQNVDAWIELSSTKPSVGCTLRTSVEVRSAGQAVSDTEVSVALFIGNDVIGADRAVTDGDGVAVLALDTSEAYGGANAWLDINVASTYLTGLTILPSDSGSCDSGGKMIKVSGAVSAAQISGDSGAGNGLGSPDVAVSVPTYKQQRNLSCEYAALEIATASWGNEISEYSFDDVVGWSANPHWGYRGEITGWWGNTTDYGVYPEPLANALSQFGFKGDVFYASGDGSQLTARIDAGIPTLVWMAMWGNQNEVDETEGVNFTVTAGMHVMVAYGYDDSGVYLSDPATGGYRYYDWGSFHQLWDVLDGMSMGVSPA